MAKVLALDLSTKRTGWATRANGKLEYGAISSSSTAVAKRIDKITKEVVELIKKYDIDEIIAEDVRPTGLNQHTGRVLMWLQGNVAVAAFMEKGIVIQLSGASVWRSKLHIKQGRGVQRESQKQYDIKYVKDTYGLDLPDDECDAIGLLDSYNDPYESAF